MKKIYSLIILLMLSGIIYPQAVGNLFGELSVTENGAATYSLDIPCPSGINGMQPKISLNYNSQSGQGIAGWGWNIGGLSMITRAQKNYFFDNDKASIDLKLKTEIPLTLDGQRLIQYNFKPGRKVAADSTFYYLENDKTTKVIHTYFEGSYPNTDLVVYQKNGIIMKYGMLTSSNYGAEYHIGNSHNENLGWALTKVKDAYGNYIKYEYTEVVESSKSKNTRISKITYGYQGNYEEPSVVGQIYFEYKTCNDITTKQYLNGIQVINTNLLSKIIVKNSIDYVIDTYELTHSSNDNKDFLTSIKRLDDYNSYFLPLTFTYNSPKYTYEDGGYLTFINKPTGYINFIGNIVGDIDGDGNVDILTQSNNGSNVDDIGVWTMYRNTGDNIYNPVFQKEWVTQMETNFFLLDLDNDGKDEVYFGAREMYGGNYYYTLNCYKYNGSTLVKNTAQQIRFLISNIVYEDLHNTQNRQRLRVLPADFLGNGNTQFLLLDKDNKLISQEGLPVFPQDFFDHKKEAQILLTDFNGNGITEFSYIINNTMTVYEFKKTPAGLGHFPALFTSTILNRRDEITTGDFNGDGNTDLLVRQYNNRSVVKPWKIFLSNGNNTFEEKDMSSYLPSTQMGFNQIYVIDANNDGKSDILYSKNNYVNGAAYDAKFGIFISLGFNFKDEVLNAKAAINSNFFASGCFKNKNAKDIYINTVGSQRLITLNKNQTYNTLMRVTDSFNQSNTITYQNFNASVNNGLKSGYALDGTEQVVKNLSAKIEVVNDIKGPEVNVSYQFSDPYFHKQGRGFLGFMKMTKTDNLRNTKMYSEKKLNTVFYILHPYKSQQSLISSGRLLTESTQNFTIVNEGNKIYFPRMDSEITKDNLNNTTTTTTYSNYDISRNALTIKIDYGNNIKEEKNYLWMKVNSDQFNRVKSTTKTKSILNESITRAEEFEYDKQGSLTKAISDKGKKEMVTTAYLNYDKFGNVGKVNVTTANGTRTTTTTYENNGRFIERKINHLGKMVTYSNDNGRGSLFSELDEIGYTKYFYDGFGRLIKSTHPGVIVKEEIMGWAGTGAPSGAKYYIKSTESGKPPVTKWFDALSRLIRTETYGINNKVIYSDIKYNALGQVQSETEPYFAGGAIVNAASYTYDDCGRVKTVTTPKGTITSTYEPLKVTVVSPEGEIVTETNSIGQTIAKTVNKKKVTYSYYASGLLKSSTPEGGKPIQMEYDLLGNRTKITDPTTGTIVSDYDSWGQLIKETQNIHVGKPATVTEYKYSETGLLQNRIRTGETTTYTYDTMNRIVNIATGSRYSQGFEYGGNNQITKKTEKIGTEKTFITTTEYGPYGRILREIYPSGYSVTNTYDTNGYLIKINDKDNKLIWQADESNAKGQLTKITKGTKSTTFSFNDKSQLTGILSAGIINVGYTYDSKDNLNTRQDNLTNQKEVFSYDAMNRLTGWSLSRNNSAIKTNTMSYYDETGDIKKMSTLDDHQFYYGEGSGPEHAITSIDGLPSNPPQIPMSVTYTDAKKLKTISRNNYDLEIFYNEDNQRYKSILKTNGTVTTTKYYAGNYEEEIKGGVLKQTHYVYGSNGLAAVYTQTGSTKSLYYAYNDNMGSLVALTDESGVVKEKYMYNPWGVRQNPTNWELLDNRASFIVNRGYTMHEHMQEFGLINMSGRVYNPTLAMFLSPDPFVQQSGNWLNHNRYTYCLNNPFRYSDPTGEWFGVDDLLLAAAGFVVGYVSHGISTGNWGGDAALSGLQMAGGAWLGYNTLGVSMNVYKYMGNMGINAVSSMIIPSFNIPISEHFGLSISPALAMGPKALGGGFNYGVAYLNGNRSIGLSAGVGPNHVSYGMGAKSESVGFSYYRTHYGNEVGPDGIPNNQVVGGAVFNVGGFSFRIENDVLGLAGRQDRWRTNAVEVGIGKYFVVGTTLNTNDPKGEEVEGSKVDNRPSLSGKLNKNGLGSWKNGQVYHSPFYIGVKQGNNVYRMGFSHPKVQDMTQNAVHRDGFIHTVLPIIGRFTPIDDGYQNYYVDYDNFQKGAYFYYGNQQPHSLWGY